MRLNPRAKGGHHNKRIDHITDLKPDLDLIKRILKVGIPAGIENGMFLDWAMRSLFFCVRFVRGRWMEQKVI